MSKEQEYVEGICQTVHEALRAWSKVNGQDDLPDWLEAPGWMRESTRMSVHNVLADPSQTAETHHVQWLAQKEAEGWRSGFPRNDVSKVHPMMVPFEALPEYEQKKDALLIAIVKALAGI